MSATDAELLEKWRIASDGEAFHELVSRHGGMVRRTCARILRDPGAADDITQECFIKLWQVKQVRGGSLGGLLHTLATHLSLNRLRAESRRREREIDYATEGVHADTERWAEVLPFVDEAIADLPEKLRYPVIMHFLEGQAYAAIAQSLTVDESTVRYRVQKALERMRQFMKRRGVALGSGALASALEMEGTHAAGLPEGLQAALGKLAVAGKTLSVGAAPLGGSVAITIGGVMLMWKHVLIVLGILAAVSGFYFVVVAPAIHHARQEAAQAVKIPPVEPPAADMESSAPRVNSTEPQNTALPVSPDVLKQRMSVAMQQNSQETTHSPQMPLRSEDISKDNGAHYFLLATELLPDLDMSVFEERWKTLKESGNINDPEFLAMLARFQGAFNAIRMGLQVGNATLPFPSDLLNTSWEHYAKFKNLARAMNMEAEYYALQGDYRSSFDDYNTVLAFGSESSRGGLVAGGEVGHAIENGAAQSLRESLSCGMATPDDYRYLIQKMADLDKNRSTISESMYDESYLFEVGCGNLQKEGVDLGTFILADKSMLPTQDLIISFADEMRMGAEYCALPYYEAHSFDLDAVLSKDPAMSEMRFSYENLVAEEAETHAQIRGTMLSAAIESYRVETGAYPHALADLVPNHIASLPEDPFSGQPFEYAPTDSGYLLYSTGPDMTNNSGEPISEEGPFPKREGDIVLHEG